MKFIKKSLTDVSQYQVHEKNIRPSVPAKKVIYNSQVPWDYKVWLDRNTEKVNYFGSKPKSEDPSEPHMKFHLYFAIVLVMLGIGATIAFFYPRIPHELLSQTDTVKKLNAENTQLMIKRWELLQEQPQMKLMMSDKEKRMNDAISAYSGALATYSKSVEDVVSINAKINANDEQILSAINLSK